MLKVNNLTGFGGGDDSPLIVYTDTVEEPGNTSTGYTTVPDADIGSPSGNRYIVVVCAGSHASGGSPYFDTVTVAGQATTKVDQITGTASNGNIVAIFITNAPVTTGTAATIDTTVVGSFIHASMSVYAVYNISSSTPVGTLSPAAASNPTGSLTTSKGGVLVAGARASSTGTISWNVGTEDYEGTLESRVYGGMSQNNTAATSTTITATIGISGAYLIAASWS